MMKKSIFKKLISVVSVLAMVISCTATVFAANEYVSVESPCDNGKTGWTMTRTPSLSPANKVNFITPAAGTDEPFGLERKIFSTSAKDAALYGISADAPTDSSGRIWYQANSAGTAWEVIDPKSHSDNSWYNYGVDGNYFFQFTTGGAAGPTGDSISTAKKFKTGIIQSKFDFAFDGNASQVISVGFNDRRAGASGSAHIGARIFRDGIRFWYPNNDGTSDMIYYDEEKTKLACDTTWYTAVLSYNMDAKVISLSIKSRDDSSFSFARSFSVNNSEYLGTYFADGVNNVCFGSYRGIDQSVVSETPNPASSKWYIDNVSLDAYSETNYAIGSIYRDDAGLETNKKADGFNLKGYNLSRFTNVVDPADAKFIIAGYDSEGRMEDVLATPLSAVDATSVYKAVTGDTVKPFILGMDTATPYTPNYVYADPETTVRKLDFEEGFVASGAGNGASITKVAEGDNNVVRFERTGFGSSYHMTYTENGWENIYTNNASAPATMWQYLTFDETVTNYEASFKLKFAGHNNPSGYQSCQFNLGAKDSPALIQRTSNGNISVTTDYDGGKSNMFVLGDNEWCEVNIKVALGDKTTGTKVDWTFKKDGVVVATFSQTVDRQDLSAGTSQVYIGSRRDNDTIGVSNSISGTESGYTTTSSVWYIDDFVVKY